LDKQKIYILTGNNFFFGQTRKPWVSMNVDKIINVIKNNDFPVEKYTFHEIVNGKKTIENGIVFYTFSQKLNSRNYIKDVVRFLDSNNNILIPSYDLLLCHENKGYQELFKKRLNLDSLKYFYFSNINELSGYEINFPIVLKSVDTSNGKFVFKINNEVELKQKIEQLVRQNFFTKMDLIRRKYFRKNKSYEYYPKYSNRKDYLQYRDYILKEHNFILQEFIPGLKCDYRVLVVSDKFYVMKRLTREGDFRASGTKIQEYDIAVEDNLLNYAKEISAKFDTPFISLDIGLYENKYYLFEYQALHFGINVVVKTRGYYQLKNGNWKFIESDPLIEEVIGNGLVDYINNQI
jgi:glutathione synthase/RimK-type ligase-like ATP-grasp enzyme